MATSLQNAIDEDFRLQLQDYGLLYDPLTGFPNHRSFRSWIRQRLTEATESGDEIALLWIDVLNVRREYSHGGYAAAERLVATVADALRPWIDSGEMICRYTDRVFVVALDKALLPDHRLNAILESASFRDMRGTGGKPEIAAGIASFPQDAVAPEELIRFASLAADTAIRTRSRGAVPFHAEMNAALLHERSLETDLRAALHDNQLTLAYQPQIDLTTGRVIGVEGLTRWNHPTRGPVSPAQFIPVAEKSDLIDEIFLHSLRTMLRDAATWSAAGFPLPSLAINASPANVRHEDFVETVRRELLANPPGNAHLDIEVTESLMMDDETLFVDRLTALRSIGVKVSLDDFGTRYTGFNALRGLPLNSMKIDKCFVHGVDQSTQAQSLCRTIVTMGEHLKLSTVAEGIEEFGELKTLQRLGCQSGQGYLFQRPVACDQFVEFLREWPERMRQGDFYSAFSNVEVDPSYEVDPLFGVG